MRITRIDAFDMNFEECAVNRKYKLLTTTGSGEKRIYVGHDEQLLDEFFDLENIGSFLILKKDLQKYLIEAKDEFVNPVQEYINDISIYYDENVSHTNGIEKEIIIINFRKKYDSQHRYYLNFRDLESSHNWDCLRDIALPRVTKLNFVKVMDVDTNKKYIYIKPSFYMEEREIDRKIDIDYLLAGDKKAVDNKRKGQSQWRRELLDEMPACIITKVTDDRILEACHIKPHNVSISEGKMEELIDPSNGLIMTPTYHRLFDMGFISFNDDGTMHISPFLSNMNKQRLRIAEGYRCIIPKKCARYLAYHRENVYNRIPDIVFPSNSVVYYGTRA